MISKRRAPRIALTVIAAAVIISVWLGANFIINGPESGGQTLSTPSLTTPTSTSSPSQPPSTTTTGGSGSSGLTSTVTQTNPTQPSSSASSSIASTLTVTSTSTSTATSTSTSRPDSSTCPIFQSLWDESDETAPLPTQNYAPLFSSYSEMSVSFSIVSSGTESISVSYTQYHTTLNGTSAVAETYQVAYSSSTTFKVNIEEDQSGTNLTATAWVLRNGTVLAYDSLGQNLTRSVGSGIFQGLMFPFIYEADYSAVVQPFTSGAAMHPQSLGNMLIGTANVAVTAYSADPLPVTVDVCGGSFTMSSYSVETGTIGTASAPLLTFLNLAGTVTYNNQTHEISSLFLKVTSVQSA